MSMDTAHIWREFSEALRGFILKRVHDEDAADDILQDAFVKIHQNIDSVRDPGSLRAWLYQLTRNTIMDHYRKRELATVPLELPESIPDDSPAETNIGAELEPCVRALMARLPEKYRQSLELTEFRGLTQKEMGQQLGLSVSGAKSRAQRARQQMKGLLLECCDFEFDQLGNIQEYQAKDGNADDCCGEQPCD